MPGSTSQAKRYLVSNVFTNILAVFVGAAVNIWLTPYLIRKLGLEVYGMIPLVISFIAYLNLFTMSISSSVSRYVAICTGRGETEKGNRYLSSAMVALLVLCGALMIPVAVISINFAKIFQVPCGHETSSGWLFFYVMLAGALLALAGPYQVSTFVRHRFDLNNAVAIGTKVLRLVVTVACFTWLAPSLEYFGVAYGLMALAFLLSVAVLTRILTPEFRISLRDFDTGAIKEMGRMTGWITVNQVGAVLYISVSFIIINLCLGPEEVGRYGPVAQLAVLLSTLGEALSNVFVPIAFEYIARDHMSALVVQLQRAIKFLGLIMGFAVGIMCGLAEPILKRWLGAAFTDLTPLVWLLIGPWLVSIAVRPTFAIFRGLDKIKVPGLVTCAGGIVNVCVSIIFIRFTSLGIYGVALALLICLAGKNLLFTPIYASAITGSSTFAFIKGFVPGTVMALAVAMASMFISSRYDLATLPRLLATTTVLFAPYAVVCYFIFMTAEERRLAWSLLLRRGIPRD
jgi:membrane protein EpsK